MKKRTVLLYLFFLLILQIADAQTPVFYGMTSQGGNYGNGTIIKINGTGSVFDTVYSFNTLSGYDPTGSLLKASNGILYGMTQLGGAQDYGAIFSFNLSDNTYTDLYDLKNTDGAYPLGNLTQVNDSMLYGLTSSGGANSFGVLFSFNINSDSYKDLYDFNTGNGLSPNGSLLLVGNVLYGMTSAGGNNTDGVIFSYNLSTSTFSKLHDFNGGTPYGSLVKASNGLFYGLTSAGGADNRGIIFSFNPSGNSYSDVYDFDGAANGGSPQGSLIAANDGNLYGMTELGGNLGNSIGYGTIFSFNPNGNTFKNQYNFSGANGYEPFGSLVQGSDGNLYGMTSRGGNDTLGNIFSYNISGNVLTNLISFNDTLGSVPYGDLIQTSPVSGINQLLIANNQLSIFPNPGNGVITIFSSKNMDKLTVTNILGQSIYESEPKQVSRNIELNDEGMYFVTVTSGNETTTKSLIITK